MRRPRRLVVTLCVSVALATTAVVLVLWAGDVLRSADLETVDARFPVRGEHAAPDVVGVGIDASTLEEVNTWIRARGGEDFKIGIGLNAGPVMAGNVGRERRMEYTTIAIRRTARRAWSR